MLQIFPRVVLISSYESASALAADLQRYLDDEAVAARPPSAIYRLRKWAKRHKNAVALSAATLLLSGLLLTGLLLTGLLVSRHRRLAELQAAGQKAVTAAEFYLADGKYDLAVVRLTEARSRLSDAPKALLPLTQRIDDLLEKAEDDGRVRRFRQLANEARAYAYFDSDLRKARLVCEEAFGSYNIAAAAEELPAELRGDAFELLLILARAQFYAAPDQDENTRAARLERALATLGQAERLRHGGPAVHLYRAEFLQRSGDQAAAKDEEQRAAEAEPQTALDHFLLGERARGADAIAHYTAALRVEADHVPSFLRMGDLYRRGKHPEQAQLCYTAALGLLPDDAISITRKTYGYRGILYQDMGDLALALAAFTAARDVDPQRWSTYALRGLLYHEMKNYQQAVDDFSEALKLIKDHKVAVAKLHRGRDPAAEVYMNRGHSYRELGQFEAAAPILTGLRSWGRCDSATKWLGSM